MSHADHPLIRMLDGFEGRVRELAEALARSPAAKQARSTSASERDGADRDRAAGDARALTIKIAAARRIWFFAPVPLDAFLQPRNRIAILAPQALRRVLAARALFRCQDGMRRCIDGRQRRALVSAIGAEALSRWHDEPAAPGLDEPLPDDLAADALARAGWRTMMGDEARGNATLENVVALSLALLSGGEAWERLSAGGQARTAATVGDTLPADAQPRSDADDTRRFFSLAGDLFPEFQWLFG